MRRVARSLRNICASAALFYQFEHTHTHTDTHRQRDRQTERECQVEVGRCAIDQ